MLRRNVLFICLTFLSILAEPTIVVCSDAVFKEVDGLIAVEAEHFSTQAKTAKRAFHLTTATQQPKVQPDGDPSHVGGASNGGYLEILPDTRRSHGDKLIKGTNFSPSPGQMAVLSYPIHIQTPGRYYVWVRAYSTGSEDNGLHVGLDGKWPASGQRLQWCVGKQSWRWESKQRTEKEHCGEPHKIFLDITTAGSHTVQFSMREDGFEFDKWLMTTDRNFDRPEGVGPPPQLHSGDRPATYAYVPVRPRKSTGSPTLAVAEGSPTRPVSDLPLILPRQPDGDAKVSIAGQRQQWHKLTLSLNGPYAHEQDNAPNPFTDQSMVVTFAHESGRTYRVPGYFAADGNAANSSAQSGNQWRAHFSADQIGQWRYTISFHRGPLAALALQPTGHELRPYHGVNGTFTIAPSDKTGRDLRAQGRLQYVGKPYLQFMGSKKYFLKAGADAPETLLGYADFDNTLAGKPQKVPLKNWAPHVQDWRSGDPTWKEDRGKGLIGAVNYLSKKGCNAFSFLTYNAGGDGDNVWPFIQREDKLHYDCSKLDQWGIVFDHGTARGMYLHFKLQETENDDHRVGHRQANRKSVPESLDGGALGIQRKLYCRELIARFAHNLALNWNLGEENTQSTDQQRAMIDYLAAWDAFDHNIVVHTYPDQQDSVYRPLLGQQSGLSGVSLQNSSIGTTHAQTVKWVAASAAAGKPWIVAFDESGTAAHGQCPDLGYQGFDGHDRTGKMIYTEHEVRKQTLWGTLLGGGAGVEYYFGYQFAQNDLICEDWRSRDRSWDYCRIALGFFQDQAIPFWRMTNLDALAGNAKHDNSVYCFGEIGKLYLVYLPDGGTGKLDLRSAKGTYQVRWFNPQVGGDLRTGSVRTVDGGKQVELGEAPTKRTSDWLVVVRKNTQL